MRCSTAVELFARWNLQHLAFLFFVFDLNSRFAPNIASSKSQFRPALLHFLPHARFSHNRFFTHVGNIIEPLRAIQTAVQRKKNNQEKGVYIYRAPPYFDGWVFLLLRSCCLLVLKLSCKMLELHLVW